MGKSATATKQKTEDQQQLVKVDGTLHKVKLETINFAETGDMAVFQFMNPRHILGDQSEGFSKSQMDELRERIRTEGLRHPLDLRWFDIEGQQYLQVVDGERRTRSLQKLVSENVECYDPESETFKPAKELYEYVLAHVSTMNDTQAFKRAFGANESAVGIGDGATTALIRNFRKHNWTDEQILEVTGKSTSWLRETDQLISLDEQTFSALSSNSINRSSALELAKIEDLTDRLNTLEEARKNAAQRLEALKIKISTDVENHLDSIESAKADKVMADLTGDTAKSEKATKKINKLENAVSKKKEKAQAPTTIITGKDVKAAKKTVGTSNAGERTSLTRAKIAKFWYEPTLALIKSNCVDEKGNTLEIELFDLKLVKTLCEAMEKGECDIVKILKHHLKNKKR